MPAIWNSVWLSLVAVAITLPIGYIAATLLRKRREHRIAAPVLDFIVAMPLSIPAVIFGVGFLLDVHAQAVRPLRHELGARPRLRDADDPVLDADAARRR